MSERVIRVSLDTALEGDRTDWARLRAMTDEEIERAIADDPDTFTADDDQRAHWHILHDKSGWRWRLVGPDGTVIAEAPGQYGSQAEARRAVALLRDAVLTAAAIAA